MGNYGLNDVDFDKSFAELFELDPLDYNDVSIKSFNFNQASLDEFNRRGMLYLGDILLLSCKEFLEIRSIGKGKFNEMLNFLIALKEKNIDITAYKISYLHNIPLTIALNRRKIVKGDFSSVELCNKNKNIVSKYVIAQKTVGEELAELSMNNPNKVVPIINALSSFHEQQSNRANRQKILMGFMSSIYKKRKIESINNYINLFPSDYNSKNILKRIYRYNSIELTCDEIDKIILNDKEYQIVMEFLRWLNLTPEFYIKTLLRKAVNNAVKKKILNLRIKGYSFSDIATVTKYSEEYIINKHNEMIDTFFSDNNSLAAFLLFSLDMGNKKCFTETELREGFDLNVPILSYLYSYSKNSRIWFDKTHKCILLNK